MKRFICFYVILLMVPFCAYGQAEFEHTYIWTAPDTTGGHCPAEGYEIEIREWTGNHTDYDTGVSSFDDTITAETATFFSPANAWHRVRVRAWCHSTSTASGDTLLPSSANFGPFSNWSDSRKQGGPPREVVPIPIRVGP